MIVLNHRGCAVVVGSKHAATLNAHGHKDWRLPTKVELDVLFNNRAAIGGFERAAPIPKPGIGGPRRLRKTGIGRPRRTGLLPAVQRFSDGRQIGQKRSVVRSWEA
jgi:hypothetical protein